MFWHSAALQFLISVVGVIVFTGLTAWDAQRLKQMALTIPDSQSAVTKLTEPRQRFLDCDTEARPSPTARRNP